MTSTVALAGLLRAMDDDALAAALDGRGIALAGIRDFFDLTEALLSPEALQACLTRLDRTALTALTALGKTRMTPRRASAALGLDSATLARLANLLLVEEHPDGVAAWPEVSAQLERWPTLGLPDLRNPEPEPQHEPVSATGRVTADRVAAEHAFAATTATAELLFVLEREPARLLARGSIGRPEARRLAEAIGVEEEGIATLVHTAELAGLVAREGTQLVADDPGLWLASSPAQRWAVLADAWAAELPDDVRRRLAERADTLWGDGLRRWLDWLYPGGQGWLTERVDARLGEAERLGITAGLVLSTPGAALLGGDRDRAIEVLAAALPTPVERLYLQQDLTAVAVGPLDPAIDARLRTMAEAGGRAIAASFRFTATSIGRAIAGTETAETILAFLGEISLSGVPQPLEYLVTETAGRHGLLRVGTLPSGDPDAVSYLRSEDPALLDALLVDRALAALALHRDGDRLLSRRDRGQVYWVLLDARYPVAAEDGRGRVVELRRPSGSPVRARVAAHPNRALVERLRLADAGAPEDAGQAWLYRQLEAAIRAKAVVTVSVRMPNGTVVDYRLEPASVAGGRLRARDPLSDIERTLPLSSIAAVTPG